MGRRNFPAATTTLRLLLRVVVAAGAITTLTMAAQTVKYAATQADLIAALGDDTTVVLNNTILLESSTDIDGYHTGIVIGNVKGLVIDGAGFAIDGQGKMRCMYVGSADVALVGVTLTNGKAEVVSMCKEGCKQVNKSSPIKKAPTPRSFLAIDRGCSVGSLFAASLYVCRGHEE